MPKFHAIVSNLPFVRFEDIKALNPNLESKSDAINGLLDKPLSNKSDLYAYLIIYLKRILINNGRIGVIISNAWLATDWGKSFRMALVKHFRILSVVISGAGRWFLNAKVVTTILVLEARSPVEIPQDTEQISFITTRIKIDVWETNQEINRIAQSVILPEQTNELITKQRYSIEEINGLESIGIGWASLFVNLGVISQLQSHLVPVSRYFSIKRGERRGWDALFYPAHNSQIEQVFLRPVLLRTSRLSRLTAEPNSSAFCCSLTLKQLEDEGYTGASRWINRFASARNGTGRPLPETLKRSNMHWYEMRANTLADLFLTLNPDKRLSVYRFANQSFVNQRLIRLTSKQNADIDFSHAILNSCVGMLLLESAGFGRGMGVLDLNATKLSKAWHMLSLDSFSQEHRLAILEAFRPLLQRNILDLPQELAAEDRISFDNTIMIALGLNDEDRSQVYKALISLFNIRQTARS